MIIGLTFWQASNYFWGGFILGVISTFFLGVAIWKNL